MLFCYCQFKSVVLKIKYKFKKNDSNYNAKLLIVVKLKRLFIFRQKAILDDILTDDYVYIDDLPNFGFLLNSLGLGLIREELNQKILYFSSRRGGGGGVQ